MSYEKNKIPKKILSSAILNDRRMKLTPQKNDIEETISGRKMAFPTGTTKAPEMPTTIEYITHDAVIVLGTVRHDGYLIHY